LFEKEPVTKPIEIKWTCPPLGEAGDCRLTRPFTLVPFYIDVPFERHWLDYTQQYRLHKTLAESDKKITVQIEKEVLA